MTNTIRNASRPLARRKPLLWAALRTALFPVALYGFLLSVALMEAGFKTFGTRFAEVLMSATANPFAGLMIGLLATSIVQSSSLTTSMMVGMVASGTLSVTHAIPLVIGANIGTTVTNTLVSLAHITRKDEFRRAFAAATVHDFFNLLTAAILLPVELSTHYLERVATLLSRHLAVLTPGTALGSPLKPLFRPALEFVKGKISTLAPAPAGVLTLIIAMVLLLLCLYSMMRIMKGALLAGKAEAVVNATIGRAPALGLAVGIVLTAMVQSSSVVTSTLVPIAAAGIFKLEHVFAITLGANIGTTVTAILAAVATGPAGLTLALAHLIFNLTGTMIFFPIPIIRNVPVFLARTLAELATRSKWCAVAYVIGVFFLLPLTCVFLWRIL